MADILLSTLLVGASSPIKSIQRGVTVMSPASQTVAVSAVDTSKSTLNIIGQTTDAATSVLELGFAGVYGKINSSTQIEFTRSTSTNTSTVSWELVEYV